MFLLLKVSLLSYRGFSLCLERWIKNPFK